MIQINTLEGFKDVKDYYYVDKDTDIWINYGGHLKPKLQGKHEDGYAIVSLQTKQGKRRRVLVHRIKATAFIPNPNPETHTQVDHINHVRDDNRIENLRWVTPGGNTSEDPVWLEKHTEMSKTAIKQAQKAKKKKVMLIDEENCKVIVFQSYNQCAEYIGVDPAAVGNAIRRNGKCGGYKLKEIGKKRY